VEVIKKYEPKIAYWQSERDKGIYDAMNIGLAKSTGRYVWFLNSGDLVNERSTLKHLHPVLLQDKWDIVYGETQMVDIQYNVIGSGSENSNRPLPETLHYNSFKYGMNVVHQSFIVKREIAPLYDLRLKHVSDIDWILRILKTEPNSYLFSEPISRFVLEGHSSQNRKAANWERFKLFSKHYGLLNNLLNHVKILFQYLK
jgi:glycosyltransferase involved in cell wall biosynthesis